jgi:hypothetical protein
LTHLSNIKRLLKDQIAADKDDDDSFPNPPNREQQIDRLNKQADRIEKWLKQNDAKIGVNKKELFSNVTDNDSAKMHTTHGTVQGYNAQALVDSKHQVIVHGEAKRWCKKSRPKRDVKSIHSASVL